MHGLGSLVWPFSTSFNPLISALLEKLHSIWYATSILLQNWLQCCIQLVNLTEIFATWGKWWDLMTQESHCIVDCSDLNSKFCSCNYQFPRSATSFFFQSMASIHLIKHGIYAQLRWKHSFPCWCDCITDFTDPKSLGCATFKRLLGY